MEPRFMDDNYLKDAVQRATRTEKFLSYVNNNARMDTSREYIRELELAIDAYEASVGFQENPSTMPRQEPDDDVDPSSFAYGKEISDTLYNGGRNIKDLFDRKYQNPRNPRKYQKRVKWDDRIYHKRFYDKTKNERYRKHSRRENHPNKSRRDAQKLVYHTASGLADAQGNLNVQDLMSAMEHIEGEDLLDLFNAEEEVADTKQPSETENESELDQDHSMAEEWFTLSNNSVTHSILHAKSLDKHLLPSKQTAFKGIVMDSGAEVTVGGISQFKAYCQHAGVKPEVEPSSQLFQFGQTIRKSLGIVSIRFPLLNNSFLEYRSHVINMNVPLLFGLDSFKKYRFYANEVTNQFVSQDEGWYVPLKHKKGHLYREFEDPVSLD